MYIYIIRMRDICVGSGRHVQKYMHRTQLFIPEKLHTYLQSLAEEEGITISEAVRRILTDYFHRTHRKNTEQGIQTLLRMGEAG